ncbi:MAG: hypothetical protein WCK89_11065 [bacterium]
MSDFTLLRTFQSLFEGRRYLHRNSALGDQVACQLYEDLVALGKSVALVQRAEQRECVVNLRNQAIGKKVRRGDGTFGELVPTAVAITASGFLVARGSVANIQIGAETKVLAKAMIKQIDRVIGDLVRQADEFKKTGGDPITVAFVGINYATSYTSYEGDRAYPTDGSKEKHPIQEAADACNRIRHNAAPAFDELQLLPFRATNTSPYPFEWVAYDTTRMEYAALLVRVSREYDRRFRH